LTINSSNLDWDEAYLKIRIALGESVDEDAPEMPRFYVQGKGRDPSQRPPGPPQPSGKRKARDTETSEDAGEADMEADESKRAKMDVDRLGAATTEQQPSSEDAAKAVAAFIPFLEAHDIVPPKLPTREEMNEVLLKLRKEALLSEYFGGSGAGSVEA